MSLNDTHHIEVVPLVGIYEILTQDAFLILFGKYVFSR